MALKQINTVLVKAEASYGVDPVHTDTDARLLHDVSVGKSAELYDRADNDCLNRQMRGGVVGKRRRTFSAMQYIRGYGGGVMDANSKLPQFHDLLQACGFVAAWAANTWTYTAPNALALADQPSLAVEYEKGGLLYIILGMRGNAKLIFPLGSPARIEYSFDGLWSDVGNRAVSCPDYTSGTTGFIDRAPELVVGATLSFKPFGADAAAAEYGFVSNVEVDLGVETVASESTSIGTTGIARWSITSRKPIVTFDVETPDSGVDANAWWDRWISQEVDRTAADISLTVGTEAGNVIKVQLGGLVLTDIEDLELDGGRVGHHVTCQLLGTSGSSSEDDIIITCGS